MPPSDNLQKTKRHWNLNKELLRPERFFMFAVFAFKIKVGFNGFERNEIKLTVNETVKRNVGEKDGKAPTTADGAKADMEEEGKSGICYVQTL